MVAQSHPIPKFYILDGIGLSLVPRPHPPENPSFSGRLGLGMRLDWTETGYN